MHKLETHLLLSIGSGDAEHEFARLVVEYRYVKGYRQTMTDPGEPEHVEIGRVYVKAGDAINPLPEWMVEPLTEQLERLCLDHWRGLNEAALERRADERRDDDMLDRIKRRSQAAE